MFFFYIFHVILYCLAVPAISCTLYLRLYLQLTFYIYCIYLRSVPSFSCCVFTFGPNSAILLEGIPYSGSSKSTSHLGIVCPSVQSCYPPPPQFYTSVLSLGLSPYNPFISRHGYYPFSGLFMVYPTASRGGKLRVTNKTP
jgi:hypothetical protein